MNGNAGGGGGAGVNTSARSMVGSKDIDDTEVKRRASYIATPSRRRVRVYVSVCVYTHTNVH